MQSPSFIAGVGMYQLVNGIGRMDNNCKPYNLVCFFCILKTCEWHSKECSIYTGHVIPICTVDNAIVGAIVSPQSHNRSHPCLFFFPSGDQPVYLLQ